MTTDELIAYEFPLDAELIYLNHAAVAPWPRRTAEAVRRFADENLHRGAANIAAWQRAERTCREQCATLLSAPSEDIALLKNTSEALSVVAHGFPWEPGDNVVISVEEFPSNRVVWESLREYGVTVRYVRLRDATDPEQALLDAADSRTRLLSVSSVQYATGLRVNLERLGELCHQRGIAFCIDAIQGLGVFPHDVQRLRADFLMADAHKWLLGPEGIAVFYCRAEWRERLRLRQYGWHMVEHLGDYDRDSWEPAKTARRFECGSMNTLGIYALNASLSLLLDVGVGEIERRTLARAERLFAEIARYPSLDAITRNAPGRYAGIVTFRHRERDAKEVHARLREHNVVCVPRGGGVRFSPHYYTLLEQLDQAVRLAAQ